MSRPTRLPAEFGKIPPDSPKSGVLASIPNTPESREALIANNIPQTAVVNRNKPSCSVQYDGVPQFEPIAGTAAALRAQHAGAGHPGRAGQLLRRRQGHLVHRQGGDRAVGGRRPACPREIYSIPTSSPLHYVTYVRVYGSSGDEVYVGYTPGYYGTVVSDDVVVYGTGYACDPWVGAYWYGCPATYGMGVYFGWNAWVGWTFGWGWGWYGGWYGPYNPWWGPVVRTGVSVGLVGRRRRGVERLWPLGQCGRARHGGGLGRSVDR